MCWVRLPSQGVTQEAKYGVRGYIRVGCIRACKGQRGHFPRASTFDIALIVVGLLNAQA